MVEYALSRTVSPALAAEYQVRLPDKRLLQAKLHELRRLAEAADGPPAIEGPRPPAAKRGGTKVSK